MSQPSQGSQLHAALKAEIEALEKSQTAIRSYLAGHDYPVYQVVSTLQAYRDTLNRISTHIMTLYQLNGQRAKITWQPLIDNLTNALENMRNSVHPNPRAAIELALNMSEPNSREVMKYLTKLKQSLKP